MTPEERKRLSILLYELNRIGEEITACINQLAGLLALAAERLTEARKITDGS